MKNNNFKAWDNIILKKQLKYDRFELLVIQILSARFVHDPRALTEINSYALILLEILFHFPENSRKIIHAINLLTKDFGLYDPYKNYDNLSMEESGFMIALNESLSLISNYHENSELIKLKYVFETQNNEIQNNILTSYKILLNLLDEPYLTDFKELTKELPIANEPTFRDRITHFFFNWRTIIKPLTNCSKK